MARFWKGVVLTSYLKRKGEFFSWPGREVWPFFHSIKKEVSKWPMKK